MGIAKDKNSLTSINKLRRRTKDRLGPKAADAHSTRTDTETRKLVNELEIHQIELEMQNAELQRAQEEIEFTRDKYTELYDFAPIGYFTFDKRGLILEVNHNGAQLLGMKKQLLANKPFSNFIVDAAGKKIFSDHLESVLREQGIHKCEIKITIKDGKVIYGQLQSVRVNAIDSKEGYILSSMFDGTAQKEAEVRIEHLASFPQLDPNPIIETDFQGKIIFYNEATVNILQKLNVPKDIRLFIPPDLNKMIKKLKRGEDTQDFSSEVAIKDMVFTEYIFISLKLQVVRIYARDITKRKRAEEMLQNTYSELEDKVKERTSELREANEQLLQEIDERKKAEDSLQRALTEIQAMKDKLETENIYFRQENKMKHRFENIIGQSDGLKYVLYRAEQVAPQNTTVLILGETGTGKELIAAAIHSMSPRKERPLITVNCAALPGNLIESELFGREKGAFTGADARRVGRFEVANGSTICLDEIGELPLELQVKLLRVIQHSEFERLGSSYTTKVDVRIVATTNRDLEEEVRQGRFRQDLFYRLNVFPITVPPLRLRKDDIPLMVQSFIERFSRKMGKHITTIPKETMKALQDYPWPGNVRELESIIERAVILCSGTVLELADKLDISSPKLSSVVRTLDDTERNQILKILSEANWRIEGKDAAAAILGIHPSTLRARMHKLGIKRPQAKEPD